MSQLVIALSAIIIMKPVLAIEASSIKQSTDTLWVDVNFPQGFSNKTIDSTINDFVQQQTAEIQKVNQQDNMPADLPGKNGLTITYEVPYNTANALSVILNISKNTRGAAHPANSIKTFNFINNQLVGIDALFLPNSNYLQHISDYSSNIFTNKNISDANWIKEGTSPDLKNYQNWYFTPNGLAIIFDTYQVAAYVYGPQTLVIPRQLVVQWMQPQMIQLVWGNS